MRLNTIGPLKRSHTGAHSLRCHFARALQVQNFSDMAIALVGVKSGVSAFFRRSLRAG